jgi:hypothetical protein
MQTGTQQNVNVTEVTRLILAEIAPIIRTAIGTALWGHGMTATTQATGTQTRARRTRTRTRTRQTAAGVGTAANPVVLPANELGATGVTQTRTRTRTRTRNRTATGARRGRPANAELAARNGNAVQPIAAH